MISGEFRRRNGHISPYLTCHFEFPDVPRTRRIRADLLVDTGADRTTISRPIAESAGLSLAALPDGGISTGVGGMTASRQVRTRLSVQGHTTMLWLRILESRHSIPPILGRDFMASFALFMEERTRRVLFLDADEVAGLGLAGLSATP